MTSLFFSSWKALQPWGRLPNGNNNFVTFSLFSRVPHCSFILSSHANCLRHTYTIPCGHLHSSLTTWSVLLTSQGHFWILQLRLTCAALRHPGWRICPVHISHPLLRSKIIPSDIHHCRRTSHSQSQKYMSKIENPYPKAQGSFSSAALHYMLYNSVHPYALMYLHTHLCMAGLSRNRCRVFLPPIWPTQSQPIAALEKQGRFSRELGCRHS